jgi:hypothetical protein
MNATRRIALVIAMAACLAGPAAAAVSVSYGDPDRFTDAADRNTDPRDVATSLADHLNALGQRYLRPGDDLRVRILDVDRAGSPRLNLPTEIRVVRGDSDFPCIDIGFDLVSNGRSVASGRERVCDRNYLTFRRVDRRYSPNDPLVYETIMLDDWFRNRFGTPSRRKPVESLTSAPGAVAIEGGTA